MRLAVVLAVLIRSFVPAVSGCGGMDPPVAGEVVRSFAPIGRYDGHWGLDYGVLSGRPVSAGDGGVVSFAGVVVGNRTVTVDHGGGVKSSYSYLSRIDTEVGDHLRRGDLIGLSGIAHGTDALHFSIRVAGSYVDPNRLLTCSLMDPATGLRLVPTSRKSKRSAYPVEREKRHTRRHVRSTTPSASHCRRSGVSNGRSIAFRSFRPDRPGRKSTRTSQRSRIGGR